MFTGSGSISSASACCGAPFEGVVGSSSSAMIGISPVSSATVTASVLPRRRRRRPPTGGAPIVPLRASSSATEIGRVSWLSGSVISSRPYFVWRPRHQHPPLKPPRAHFHQLRCRVSAESGPPATPTGRYPPFLLTGLSCSPLLPTRPPRSVVNARSSLLPVPHGQQPSSSR